MTGAPPAAPPRTAAVRLPLGLLFFAWMYGTPFLAVVGIIRRAEDGYFATAAAAERFAAVTDRFLIGAIVLNVAAPVIGLTVAVATKDAYWKRHFRYAVAGMLVIFLAYAVAESSSLTGLIGHVPVDHAPRPAYTGCVAYSGGRNTCPGG
jgi:hypothetical protein